MKRSFSPQIRFRHLLNLCLVLVSVAFLTMGCKPEEIEKQLICSTDTLVIQADEYATLNLTNNTDELCYFVIDEVPNWLWLGNTDRCILPKSTLELVFFARISSPFTEPLFGTFQINSTFGTIPVVVKCNPFPHCSYNIPNELHFPLGVDTERLTIENIGNVELDYSVTSFSTAISTTQTSGKVNPGMHVNIGVSIDREAIRNELEKLYLIVTINGETNTVLLLVDME